MDIGSKIKELRLGNDLTLEELASRCELTKGFLSQVERNLTSPSISTLEDILEALGTSLSAFFAEKEKEQVVFTAEDYFVDEKEDYTIYWIVPNAQKNEMEPILMVLEPHKESNRILAHAGQEFGYVLDGVIRIVMEDGSLYTVKKGETFYLTAPGTHHLASASRKEARVLWVSAPPIF